MSLSSRFAKINPPPPVEVDSDIAVSVPANEVGAAEEYDEVDEYIAGDEYDQGAEGELQDDLVYLTEEAAPAPTQYRAARGERWGRGGARESHGQDRGSWSQSSNTCFNCGGFGHYARDCPSQRRTDGKRPGGKLNYNMEERSSRQSRDNVRPRGRKPDAQSLDDDLDNYWKKAPGTKKLDDELDNYWKSSISAALSHHGDTLEPEKKE